MFELHPRLAADTREVTRLPLCRVLLMNDRRFPWLILVPQRPEIREIHQLSPADRATLVEEIARVAQAMEKLHKADKMNVAALGNQVPQLHVHVIARFASDPAWPNPIWGRGTAEAYEPAQMATAIAAVKGALGA
ncbi:MAG: HIT domain-containing protein [Rhodospirillales bacterium]|nr:HIT domain-containing protein [Rhodospirillales bacterium]